MRLSWLSTLIVLNSVVAIAAPDSAIDSSLAAAATEGYWEQNDSHGTYRVLVFSGGVEHVSSLVIAEWISEPTSNNSAASVVHSVQLIGGGFVSLGPPVLSARKGYLRVTLSGVDTHAPERKVSCIFDLLPSRLVRKVKDCELQTAPNKSLEHNRDR